MKKERTVVHKIQCVHNEEHIFEKTFKIEDGSGDGSVNEETELQAYCPFCDKSVTVIVKGKVLPDKELLRKYKIE